MTVPHETGVSKTISAIREIGFVGADHYSRPSIKTWAASVDQSPPQIRTIVEGGC